MGATPDWVDPREDPRPPYQGPPRALAAEGELLELIDACKQGRIYDVERWIKAGRPLQLDPDVDARIRRKPTPLSLSISSGTLDLTRLLLCNGYRQDLESSPPLDAALTQRRWDLLELLLEWGGDPASADVELILGTYQRSIFELFWNMGVDLEDGRTLAYVLADSTRNRPLYGFVKNYRERDPRIQRGLDTALGHALCGGNDKAVSLCMWAGANPRRRVEDIRWGPEPEDEWITGFESAVMFDEAKYLKKMGFDADRDDPQSLYEHVCGPKVLDLLVKAAPPRDWNVIVQRVLTRYANSRRLGFDNTDLGDVLRMFELGGRLTSLDRYLKRDLRQIFLSLYESDAKQLFDLLRDPTKVAPDTFLAFISQEKVAGRILTWKKRDGVDKDFLATIATTKGMPASIKREARTRIRPPERVMRTHTLLVDHGEERLFAREEFYEIVWITPLSRLAERFGISGNAILKRCKTMNVPTPPRGYWQREKGGYRVTKTPLPRLGSSD